MFIRHFVRLFYKCIKLVRCAEAFVSDIYDPTKRWEIYVYPKGVVRFAIPENCVAGNCGIYRELKSVGEAGMIEKLIPMLCGCIYPGIACRLGWKDRWAA